jgi:tetratricopeptide (TPR) repeat protein
MQPARSLCLGLLLFLLPVLAHAAEEKPEMTAYRYGALGRSSEMLGNNAEALDYFNKSLAIKPDPIIYSNRAKLKLKLKDSAGAIADYDQAIALKPDNVAEYFALRGGIKSQSGDFTGAVADFDQSIVLRPDRAVFYNNRAIARANTGDATGALADYDRAILLQPRDVRLLSNRAGARKANGDLAGALADYDLIVMLEPDDQAGYSVRADIRLLMDDLDSALADYNEICELLPEHPYGYYRRGVVHQALGHDQQAVTDYETVERLEQKPSSDLLLYREISLRKLHRGTSFADLARMVAGWPEGWDKTIGLYLIEALDEPAFLARAKNGNPAGVKGRECSANYFIGVTKLLAGDKAVARESLEQCLSTGLTALNEFTLAKAELARLTVQP